MTIINRDSFEAGDKTKTHSFGTITDGSIEVTLKGKTKRVEGSRWDYNDGRVEYHVYRAFTGRYVTGGKAWPASVVSRDTYEMVDFGRDDRSGRFNKANALHWNETGA